MAKHLFLTISIETQVSNRKRNKLPQKQRQRTDVLSARVTSERYSAASRRDWTNRSCAAWRRPKTACWFQNLVWSQHLVTLQISGITRRLGRWNPATACYLNRRPTGTILCAISSHVEKPECKQPSVGSLQCTPTPLAVGQGTCCLTNTLTAISAFQAGFCDHSGYKVLTFKVWYCTVRFNITLATLQVILGTILQVRWPNQQCHCTEGQ